jgi:hypothetical protein
MTSPVGAVCRYRYSHLRHTSSIYVRGTSPSGSSSSPLPAFFFAFHQSSSVLFSRTKSRSPSLNGTSPSDCGRYSKSARYTPRKTILLVVWLESTKAGSLGNVNGIGSRPVDCSSQFRALFHGRSRLVSQHCSIKHSQEVRALGDVVSL